MRAMDQDLTKRTATNRTRRRKVEAIQADLTKLRASRQRQLTEKLVLAAVGSLPWVGAVAGALLGYKIDRRKSTTDELHSRWLEEHGRRLDELARDLLVITRQIASLGPRIDERIKSERYLALVRRAFRAWDRADSREKREYLRALLASAASTRVCSDDVVRLFVDWIDQYDEAHFALVRSVRERPGSTRAEMWARTYGQPVREDSAEADLFRLLVRDLTVGGVIRQERPTTADGRFVRKRAPRNRTPAPPPPPTTTTPPPPPPDTLDTAFEDTKPYRLTALGEQFVSYVMTRPAD